MSMSLLYVCSTVTASTTYSYHDAKMAATDYQKAADCVSNVFTTWQKTPANCNDFVINVP